MEKSQKQMAIKNTDGRQKPRARSQEPRQFENLKMCKFENEKNDLRF